MIEILVEHAWFLVINKPSGLLTQAVPGVASVQTVLVDQLQARDGNAPTPFIGIPHRLDRVTTGTMVVARNQRALKRLSEQFASRKVQKIYHAVIPRIEDGQEIVWRDWLRKVENEPRAEIVTQETEGAKEAVLRFRCLSQNEISVRPISIAAPEALPVSLVEIELETGRMHQIRIQFGSRGFPLLGDVLYGSPWCWLEQQTGERESPIALHASKIEFRNPQNAELVSVTVPHPQAWPMI